MLPLSDSYSMKPFDEARVIAEGKSKKAIITAEDPQHYRRVVRCGGGDAGEKRYWLQTTPVGVKDKLGKAGSSADLFRMYGLTAENIVKRF